MDAITLRDNIRSGTLSPTDVVEAILGRIDELDPVLHAFCTPTPELARTEAKRIERDLARGHDVGALAGVPVGIKDLVCTKGIRTTSGSFAYENFIPDEDDVAVERLRHAGAIIVGKTNVPEFGYSAAGHNPVFPTTRNPWNIERTPGGSSAGSGAAVAAGMSPFAIASDGGGSIRIPAAHCGLFGMKASMGRVPLYPGTRDHRFPGMSSWESIEHIGPISRTVADAALMLSVIGSGPDRRDRHSLPGPEFQWNTCFKNADLTGLRIAYSPDWGYAPVDPEVRSVVGTAVEVFERELNCIVDEAHPGFEDPSGAFWGLVAADTDLAGMRRIVAEYGDRMTPHLVDFINQDWRAEDLTNAVMSRKALNNSMWRFMEHYDVLLTPTVAVPPFGLHMQGPEKIDGHIVPPFAWLAFTLPFNMTGQPAASIPAGFTPDGLPVGLQIVGRHLDDPTVLRVASAFETVRPWRNTWPDLVNNLV